MFDLDRKICYCNDANIEDIVECIKDENIETIEALLQQQSCPIGDKCELCHEDGYENDGYSIAMIMSLVKQKRL